MTRNTLDDLSIMSRILFDYIDFIKIRTIQEVEYMQKEYQHIDLQSLSSTSKSYLLELQNFNLSSSLEFYHLLSVIEKKLSLFDKEFQTPLPLYSSEVYQKSIQEHFNQFKKSFYDLAKH